MKVEMVMTPEACRRQTSKNSRDSSAFIAHLPTPLFLLHLFFFAFHKDCVCVCVRALFHLSPRRVSFLLPPGLVGFIFYAGRSAVVQRCARITVIFALLSP